MKLISSILVVLAIGCGRQPHTEHEEHAHAEHEEGVVALAADAGVQTVALSNGSGFVTTRLPGRVDYNQDVTATISSPLEGRLQKWLVNIGDHVRMGDVLALVQNPQNLDNPIQVKALIDGQIIERESALGAWVKPEDRLFIISDLSTVWAVADVREDLLGKIITDAPAHVRVLSFPNENFEARVLRSHTEVEPETRTVEFLLAVPNTDRKLRPGMFAQVSMATGRVENKLLVPDEAVQTARGQSVVFVEESAGRYRLTPVRLGHKLGELYEVRDGLPDGVTVVTTGSFILKSEYLKAEMGEGHAH